jgi:hypothetical protein
MTMTLLAKSMLVVFIAAWCTGVAAWFYSMRFFMPMWLAGFRHREEHRGYSRKTLIGAAVFIGAIAVGFAAGGIAQYWGGGWGS